MPNNLFGTLQQLPFKMEGMPRFEQAAPEVPELRIRRVSEHEGADGWGNPRRDEHRIM